MSAFKGTQAWYSPHCWMRCAGGATSRKSMRPQQPNKTNTTMTTRKTKIICTLGPATAGVDRLVDLIGAGMNVARLNFSHGTHEAHGQAIRDVREAARRTGVSVAVLLDLQGPKIRTGPVRGGVVHLEDGATFTITTEPLREGDAQRVGCTYTGLANDVKAGDTLLLDDGYLNLQVERVAGTDIITRVIKGGALKNGKGIIVPGAAISAPALSQKDIEDALFGLSHGVDAIALSFVASEQDVLALRGLMREHGRIVPIVAKIERWEGVSDIEDIVRESDAVMVARGDLGLEMPAEQVPVLQKRIIARCNFYGKPVITATQMLESMIGNPRPTRAEASDVANAVIDGTDCVMLSGETSVGRYPIEAVRTMDAIIRTTEAHFPAAAPLHERPSDVAVNTADAIGHACCAIAEQTLATAIVTLTSSGNTARLIARHRPAVPILALTDNEQTQRQLALTWGVNAIVIPRIPETSDPIATALAQVVVSGFARAGDTVVFTAGTPFGTRSPTNLVQVVLL